MRYFYRKGDRVSGPFDLERIRGALSRGSIDPETPITVAAGGSEEPPPNATWVPLREGIPELFGQPRAASAARTATPAPATPTPPAHVEFQAPRAARNRAGTVSVEVVDIRMSFWAMVVFMVKWAIASIPAAIILILIVLAITTVLGGVVTGILSQLF